MKKNRKRAVKIAEKLLEALVTHASACPTYIRNLLAYIRGQHDALSIPGRSRGVVGYLIFPFLFHAALDNPHRFFPDLRLSEETEQNVRDLRLLFEYAARGSVSRNNSIHTSWSGFSDTGSASISGSGSGSGSTTSLDSYLLETCVMFEESAGSKVREYCASLELLREVADQDPIDRSKLNFVQDMRVIDRCIAHVLPILSQSANVTLFPPSRPHMANDLVQIRAKIESQVRGQGKNAERHTPLPIPLAVVNVTTDRWQEDRSHWLLWGNVVEPFVAFRDGETIRGLDTPMEHVVEQAILKRARLDSQTSNSPHVHRVRPRSASATPIPTHMSCVRVVVSHAAFPCKGTRCSRCQSVSHPAQSNGRQWSFIPPRLWSSSTIARSHSLATQCRRLEHLPRRRRRRRRRRCFVGNMNLWSCLLT